MIFGLGGGSGPRKALRLGLPWWRWSVFGGAGGDFGGLSVVRPSGGPKRASLEGFQGWFHAALGGALAGVADMAEANAFLASDCPPRHNAEFMRPAREQGSAYAPVLSMGVVDDILCGHHSRMVGRDNCVQFDGLALQVARIRGVRSFTGAKVTVRRHLNGFISVGHGHMTLGEYAPNGEPVNAP